MGRLHETWPLWGWRTPTKTRRLSIFGMRTLQRLGQRHSDRRTFSDLPNLVHGPQELPDQSDAVRRERNTLHDA